MRIGLRRLSACLAALMVLAGCSISMPVGVAKQVPARGGSVAEAIVGKPGNLNPLFAAEDNARDIDALVYQGLTTIGPDQQPKPQLASSWSVSSDGLTYTFTLRRDVRWADGARFTAADVLFTFSILQAPDYSQPDAAFWREVTVAQPASDQVSFTLKAQSASFPSSLRVGIIPKHAFKTPTVAGVQADPASGARAFGTGPFMVQSISSDRTLITLRRNPHADPAPYLDQFGFQTYPTLADAVEAVAAGQADGIGGVQPPQAQVLTKRPDLVVHEKRTFTVAGALFNVDPAASPFFASADVRRALERAIDRTRMIRILLGGQAEPAPGPIPPSDWAYSAAAGGHYPYDPVAAGAALDAAGWKVDPATGIRVHGSDMFRFTLVSADAYPYLQVSREIALELKKVGVEVDVSTVPAAVLVSRYLVGRHFAMALVAFDNGPDPDQWSLWHSGQPPDSLSFAGMPGQAFIDKDLEDGRAASDLPARMRAYADFQELIAQAAPAVFLYSPDYGYVLSARVKGVRLNRVLEPVDRFQSVTDWYVQTAAG